MKLKIEYVVILSDSQTDIKRTNLVEQKNSASELPSENQGEISDP